MTASAAHLLHPADATLQRRTEVADLGHKHLTFTLQLLGALCRRTPDAVAMAFRRWSERHRQAVQDRIFWELALTDSRVMADLHAAQARAEAARTSR